MPTSDPRRTLQDPWVDLSRGSISNNSKRAYSSTAGHKHHPAISGAKELHAKAGGGSRQGESEKARLLGKYEASLGRALNQRGKPGFQSPAMDVWALALGVDIEHSKATDRARRKVELEEAGHITEPGGWTPLVPPTTAPNQSLLDNQRKKRGRDALGDSAGSRRSPVVPEVTALDGFLSDLQQRLKSVEGGAVRSSTVVPQGSVSSEGGRGRGATRLPRRAGAVTGIGDRDDEAPAVSSSSLVDVYGISQAFVANAEEARRQWDIHHANLERRDEEFLDLYKRGARMSGVQVSIAKAWRGFVYRRKFIAWKGRRQWSVKIHLRAWSLAARAERLYSGNLKRAVFTQWNEIVEEDRNTRVMGELSFEAAVSSTRLSRQAVVQFFQDHAPTTDDLSPAVLRNKASVKRRILKLLFQSWRDAANWKQKAAAQAAFKMCKAVRLHTASAMLWAPEIVSLLFQVWSRMALYKKAVREEREPPTFLPENGYAALPEWDAWVASKGRHLELKRRVIHIGGQIFLRNKFRRWVWFAKWSLSQEDRVLEASQHFEAIKVAKVFAAWAGVCRDRGSMLRRITRCWQGWSSFTRRRKKAKMLKKKTVEHLRLLRTGSVMNDMTAYARDGKVLSAFTVAKLLLSDQCFGGLALSYIATGRVTQLFALLAWQAWKKCTTKRRRWTWLLYEHTRTEALHTKQAVFRAWSYATGRRYRPDAASLTLSASLPFSMWDRFVKNYVDQGVVPMEQLHKDMVDHSVMQQQTAWWLLGQTGTGEANVKASGLGAGEGGPGRPNGRMELPHSGSGSSGGLGKLAFPRLPGGKGPTDTDWQALTPALFAAVDECDTAAVIDLLQRGAQVNSVYVPPKVSSIGGVGDSRKRAAVNKQDEGSSTPGGDMLEPCRALDLPAPALVANQDGTFEMRGTTPLHAAAGHLSADFTSIVITLLHAGACVDALDAEGRTPLQVCTSPQVAALLNDHAARLQQFRFSSQELRWGQQVLTSSRSSAGAAGLWRYIVRAAVVARLDKLRATLRVEDTRAEDAALEAARKLKQQQQLGLSALTSAEGIGRYLSAADVGLDEREKELIRMKMERLDAAKTIVDREHALHSGTAGAPSTSGGGGSGGAGGSAQGMKHLFHDLDKIVTLRASEKETSGALPGSGNSRGGNKRRSLGVGAKDHEKGNKRTGKERTAADHRKAFSARRADAASWFRAFRDDLAKADMLRPKAESPTSGNGSGSTAGAQVRDGSVARKVLAIVGDAGGENRNAGAGAGRGGGRGGRVNSAVLGSGAGGASMLGRGGNTSGTDAFTITEVNDCYKALGSVLDERKRVMDQRAARDDALIERGNWVGLQRAMEASKHGQHDVPSIPSFKRRTFSKKKRAAASSRSSPPTAAATDSASGSASVGQSSGTPATGAQRYGCLGGCPEEGAQDKASEELAIDVIPTSSSKRCHSASVVLRGTVDSEVLGRARSTIAAWKKGGVEREGKGSAGHTGTYGRLADEQSSTFGRGVMSRVPQKWWGQGGGRVLGLMLEERRKLRAKGATLTAQAKELEDNLASKSESLQQLYSREHDVGTTVRDVAMETKKSETRFREDMERWQTKIQQAHGKIRAIARRRAQIAEQTAHLEDTLANWDTREIPTASERAKKKKSKEKEEEVTPETLRRDIDAKRELIISLSAKENQSMETIENAKVQLEESRVYLLRIQSILTKYASYNMGKMDILEREFQECSRQQGVTKDRQRVLGRQIQALSKRLAELDKAITILRPLNTTVSTEKVHQKPAFEDSASLQDDHDVDHDEVSPSTSRRGSKVGIGINEEAESSAVKRKRSSGGGHRHESIESDAVEDRDDNSGRRNTTRPSSSRKGMLGSSSLVKTSPQCQREEVMASLLTLIDENTAIVDTDMCSLDSTETASTASGAKRRNRQGKRRKTASSTKTTATTHTSAGGTHAVTTSSETKLMSIAIPTPSSAKEGETDPLATPGAWPAEGTPVASVRQQPVSESSATSPIATPVKASSPKSSRSVQRKRSPSPLQKGSKKNKNLKASPRGGKAKADKGGRQTGAGAAALVAETAKQLDQDQPADADSRALNSPSVSRLALEEEKRLEDIRVAQEAKELAEEEECRRLWDEEDAEEMEAWRARREAEEVLEISPKLSKEDTVLLLTAQYDQALKQTFEPERRAAVAKRIAIVEAEQREKERKAEAVRPEEEPEDLQSEGSESNPTEGGLFAKKAADISHLLDEPGLGLTREEIETLFDIVDEGAAEAAKRKASRDAEEAGGGLGGDDDATGKRHSGPGVRRADRGLLLFLRKRGLRRPSTEPLEDPIDVLNSSPRPRPAPKPELDDYMVLNFVGGGNGDGEGDEKYPSATATSDKPGAPCRPPGGDVDQSNEDSSDGSSATAESAMWRGRGNTTNEESVSRGALKNLAHGDDGPLKDRRHNKAEVADHTTDGEHEDHLYPRTLGSSVSVLDEKDAVLRTGGLRFAGEDPIRGRLRATDPFLWMGRLHAGTSAISGLIHKANDALKSLDGSDDSDASDGRSNGHQKADRMQDVRRSRSEVVGPSSRGSGKSTDEKPGKRRGQGEMTATQQLGRLGSTVESFNEGEGSENGREQEGDPGEIDRSCASSEHFSSSSNIAVEQLSSTMSAYSQSMEANRVIAGGVLIEEEEEEEEEEDSEREEHDQGNHSKFVNPAGPRKGPGPGSGPCPMRGSPVNARSAARGTSAKLRNKDTGVGKAKMAALIESSSSSGNGQQSSCHITEATTPTGREDWGEDESQDIQFDDIVSGIARDVASRAPPTPRQSGEAVSVRRAEEMGPPWSAEERVSPTRRQRDGTNSESMRRKRWRPRSTPAGLRAQAEAASTVLDPRPPWSLPLDSVFAPRVKGAVQPKIVTASPRRRFSEADSQTIGDRDGQHRQGMPPRGGSLVVRGSSALRRPRVTGGAALGINTGIASSGFFRSTSSSSGRGTGRRIGSAPEGSTAHDEDHSADEAPQEIRRCHSASEALLVSGLLQEAPRLDDAPAAADGIWSWGWHDDGGQEKPSTAASRDTFTPLMTPELCKRTGRLGLRGTSPLRKKGRSGDALSFEKPLSSRAPSLLRYSRNHSNLVDSDSHGGGGSTRPWTTGELADNDSRDGATTASTDGFLQYDGRLQSRARSADGDFLSPYLADSDLRSATEHPADAVDLLRAKADGLISSAEGVSKNGRDSFGTIGADGQGEQGEKLDGGDGIDGAGANNDDCENSEVPVVFSQPIPRKVSFADDQNNSDCSGESTEVPDSHDQHRARRGSRRRRISSIIGSSDGYLEGDGIVNGHFMDNNERRKSDLERCRRAMEIARVAHDILFLDTRPDGLRPITGTPMTDGKNAQGSGGLYVGLAGLRGFDLSFIGAVPTNLSDTRQSLGSVAASLAAHRRLSTHAAATNDDENSVAGAARSSSPYTRTASPSNAEASWMAQGFLLDRKPGSLVPRLPPSAGRAPAAEMGPTKNNSSNGEADDHGVDVSTNNRTSPEATEGLSESPVSPVARSNAQQAQRSAAEDDNNSARGSFSRAPHLAKGDSSQTHDVLDGREQIDLGGSRPGVGERMRHENGANSEVPPGTTAVSNAATAMASLFTPKAAVLWSARDLGVDELVFSVAGDQEVLRPPGSRDFTSRALLAAYQQASPVFEVEASGWSKHEGAVAGVDYPLQPPDGWGGSSSDLIVAGKGASSISESERDTVWKSFERRPISRAEARALREVRLSQGIRNGERGSGAGSAGVGESAMRMIMPEIPSNCSVSTSRGTTEDNVSLVGSISDRTSAMSVDKISSSLHRPFSEAMHPKRRGKTPMVGTENIISSSSNVSASSSARHEHRRSRSCSGRTSSPSPENKDVRVPDYSMEQQQQQQRQGRGSSPHEDNRLSAGENKLPSSELTPGRPAPPWASDPCLDPNDEAPPGNFIAEGARSGGEGLSPSSKNVPRSKQKHATAPTPGLGLGLSSESLFCLNGEADADNVLRAMLRLGLGMAPAEANTGKNGRSRHHTSAGAPGKRPTESGRSSNATAPTPAPASSALRCAEAGGHRVCRGNTPSIKGGQKHSTKKAIANPSSTAEKSALDIEGRPLQPAATARRNGFGSSRVSGRFEVETSGRKSAPQMGRRWRRSSVDKARATVGSRKVLVLSKSQSAPSGIFQRPKQRPLSSNIGCVSGGGGGEDAGGRMPKSLVKSFSRSGLTRQGSIPSLTVSSTCGASQQPLLSASNRSESNGGTNDQPKRGTPSRSEVEAAGGYRGRSRRLQQHHRPKKTAVHEERLQPSVSDACGSSPLSGSQIKVRNESRGPAGKASEDSSSAQSGKTNRHNLVGKASSTTVDGMDDRDGDDNIKTSRELSEIIADVTRDAAAWVVPPRRDPTADVPLISAETGQPLSPTEDVVETAASCSTAAIKQLHRSPSATGNTLLERSNAPTSVANATQREGKAATRRTDNRREMEGGARNTRGGGKETNGSASTANSSSRLLGGTSQQNSSKAEKPSLHDPRLPIVVSNTESNGTTRTPAVPGVTDVGAVAEVQATINPGARGGREERSPATDDGPLRAGGLVIGTALPDPNADSQEIPTGVLGNKGSDVRGSHEGNGVPSNSRSWKNDQQTTGSGGGSPNSHGSSSSSRSRSSSSRSSDRGDSQTRQIMLKAFQDQMSDSNARNSTQVREAKTHGDVSCRDTCENSLPLLDKPETTAAAGDAQQDARQHSSIGKEDQKPAAMSSPRNVVEPQKLPRISSAGGGRSKAAGSAAENADRHEIKVHSRPVRVESKDLRTTTEALTTHHLTVDELLKGGYDELLDESEDEDDAGDRRMRERKEPLLIPHGARVNGMAYWQKREAKERGQRRRPRSTAHDDELLDVGASVRNVNGSGDVEGPQAGGGGQWEDEKEEIKRLLLAARARREAAVARVRAQREQAKADSEREILSNIDDSATATTTAPAQDENGSSAASAAMTGAPAPASANEKLSAKSMPAGVGGPTTTAKSVDGKGTLARRAAITPSSAPDGGQVGRGSSGQTSTEAPPWKGFTLSDDTEAMLRRGRIPSPEREPPVEGVEDWEYQLIVPGTKDNLVNFSVDTAAVRANYGKLRRRAEIRQWMGLDEEDDSETKESNEDSNNSTRLASPRQRNGNAAPTGDDAGSNRPDKRRSVFSAERRVSSTSTGMTGALPEISIRRRTMIAGVGDDHSDAAGSPPSDPGGTIAQASRIIMELEQDHGEMEFPLDALRRESGGFGDDDNGDEL